MLDYQLIQEAADRLRKRVRVTELIHSHHFSERLGTPLYLKCENLQRTGAFKIRGSMNVMTALPRAELLAGVITASAGNHAQGVAFAADLLGVKATIYMPESTPPQKVFATRDYGAEVVLSEHGARNREEAANELATRLAAERGYARLHPFDDPLVVAGQASCGVEIARRCCAPAARRSCP